MTTLWLNDALSQIPPRENANIQIGSNEGTCPQGVFIP